ncbi:hypothetical protein ASD52_04470 [Ensifer sp. Root142]|nr:hypothetical protein ASD52_04470 [Ensifer sp. Root142]
MCISLYHRPADLRQMPWIINSMVGDYTFAVRQHLFDSLTVCLCRSTLTRARAFELADQQ